MPIITCADQRPSSKIYIQKYWWDAIQRPSSKVIPKSIIGPIPNTNKNLRYPAPVFKTYPRSIVGAIPDANSNLRYPAPICKNLHSKMHNNIFKIRIQKCYWY